MEKIVKTALFIFAFAFIVLLVAEKTGYYESRLSKAKTLTEEQIKVFEEDIKQGKQIDVSSYVTTRINYSNKLSNDIYKTSLQLEKGINYVIKYIFKYVNEVVD